MPNTEREELLDELAVIEQREEELKEKRPEDFFKPMPGGQKAFWDSALKEKWIFGGNQGGKTITMCSHVAKRCRTPKQRWFFGSTSMDKSKKVTQKKFWDSVNKDRLDPQSTYKEDKGFPDDTVKYKNGSVVYFLSYEMDRDKWAGDTVNGVAFDEEPPWGHFLESQKRVAGLDGELVGAMTAVKSFTKLVNRVYLVGGRRIGLFMVPLHENHVRYGGLYTDERIREIIEDTPEEDRPTLIYGIPTFKTGLVYRNWNDREPWIIPLQKEFKIPNHWPRYMAIDPHAHINQAAIWIAVAPNGQHYQYLEFWENMLIPQFAQKLRMRNTPVDVEIALIDNHYSTQKNAETGKTIKQLLFEYGDILTVGGCDDVIARIDMVKAWDKINPATGLPRLQTFESCEQTRWERKRYEWSVPISEKVAERKDARQKPKDKNGHLMNCTEYLAAYGGINGLPFVEPEPPDYIKKKIKAHEQRMKQEAPVESPVAMDYIGAASQMYI